MMNYLKSIFFVVIAVTCGCLEATPTSLFWTNCITDIEPKDTLHIDVDNYFTVFNRRGHGQSFAPDVGLLYGLAWGDLKAEVGFDYLGGTDDPLFFNAKIGVDEGILFSKAPAFNVGIFDIGTRTHTHGRTNFNIVDFIFGKSLPDCIGGKLFVAAFSGSRAMGKNRQGFEIGYQRNFCKTKDCNDKEYYKWVLAIDYASGKNIIGGGGIGINYYFTPDIALLTGPVFFNDASLNGTWKWSVQLDIDIPFTCKKS